MESTVDACSEKYEIKNHTPDTPDMAGLRRILDGTIELYDEKVIDKLNLRDNAKKILRYIIERNKEGYLVKLKGANSTLNLSQGIFRFHIKTLEEQKLILTPNIIEFDSVLKLRERYGVKGLIPYDYVGDKSGFGLNSILKCLSEISGNGSWLQRYKNPSAKVYPVFMLGLFASDYIPVYNDIFSPLTEVRYVPRV